ncbi:MAG: transporter substrate-binding domain-containing protein [Desulfobacter sp.]|nr:MAG: transporter substrate-binding domain-containing protein [Desulfobacter sp.]
MGISLTAAGISPVSAQTYQSGLSREHASGIVSRIMQRVGEKLDINLEMKYAPFARRLLLMKSGKIDIMGGLLKRESRMAYIHFVSPPYVKTCRKVFFVRKGEARRIQAYEDLYGLEIGTKIHSKYFPRFDQDKNLNIQPVSSLEQNFKKLLLKRIDAVIYSYRSGYTTMMKMGITDQVEPAVYYFEGKNAVHIGISKKSPLMAEKDRVASVVKEMVESGEMKSIIDAFYTYLPEDR